MVKFSKNSFFYLFSFVFIAACSPKFLEAESDKINAANEKDIQTYAAAKNLSLTRDQGSGVYYNISKANPSGQKGVDSVEFNVAYKLSTLDGTLIEEKTAKDSVVFNVYRTNLLVGFRVALGTLKEGETGKFLIPSALAYGENPPGLVPKNAVIVLDIEIINLLTEDEVIERYILKKGYKNIETTKSGLKLYRLNARTTNDSLKSGDVTSVVYTGTFINDRKFDSGTFPYTVGTSNVIAGFREGILKLRKGEKAILMFPSRIGYGNTAGKEQQNTIPPFSALVFNVEIATVNGK